MRPGYVKFIDSKEDSNSPIPSTSKRMRKSFMLRNGQILQIVAIDKATVAYSQFYYTIGTGNVEKDMFKDLSHFTKSFDIIKYLDSKTIANDAGVKIPSSARKISNGGSPHPIRRKKDSFLHIIAEELLDIPDNKYGRHRDIYYQIDNGPIQKFTSSSYGQDLLTKYNARIPRDGEVMNVGKR